MCPLRLLLVFLSATIAGYFALKAVRSPPPPPPQPADSSPIPTPAAADSGKKRIFEVGKVVGAGFWVFLDMASGRYLWRTIKER